MCAIYERKKKSDNKKTSVVHALMKFFYHAVLVVTFGLRLLMGILIFSVQIAWSLFSKQDAIVLS